MYHVIEFVRAWWVNLERGPGRPVEQVLLARGSRLRAELRPHVLECGWGLMEAADLFFEDGSVAHDVPFASLTFVDRSAGRPTK